MRITRLSLRSHMSPEQLKLFQTFLPAIDQQPRPAATQMTSQDALMRPSRTVWRHCVAGLMQGSNYWSHSLLRLKGFVQKDIDTSMGHIRAYDRFNPDASCSASVLVMHGLGASSIEYGELMRLVSDDVERVVGIDLPGHGSSAAAPADFNIPALSRAVHEAVQKLELKPPVIVFGNSMGGFAATLLALEPGNPVDCLVLSSPAGAPMTEAELDEIKALFALRSHEEADAFVTRIFAHPPMGALRHIFTAAVRNQFDNLEVQRMINSVSIYDVFDNNRLKQVKARTLVYWGDHDQVLPLHHRDFWRHANNPKISVYDVPGAGHMPFFEEVETVRKWIVDACQSMVLR